MSKKRDKLIEQWLADRLKAFSTLDEAEIKAYCRKYEVPIPKDNLTFWAGVHKARTAMTDLPMAKRSLSKSWLLNNGFESEDGGTVPLLHHPPHLPE